MADEVLRVRLLEAMAASFRKIVPGGPERYHFDLSERPDCVVIGRNIFGDDDRVPMVTILEVPVPLDQIVPPPDSSYSRGTWDLLVQGFVPDDKEHPTRPAHHLMADVKYRLAVEKRRNKDFAILGMGNHIVDLRIGAGVVRPPNELSEYAFFWLNVAMDIVEDLMNPYED